MASKDLLKKAVAAFAAFKALSPEQQAEMLEEQRQSWVRGNVGLSRDERGMTSPVMPQPTTVMVSELEPWRYEIKYGPDGEDSYSWVYDDQGVMVAPMRTHKAKEVVDRMNTRPAPVDVNPLASNPVDDKIAPDTSGNAPVATDTGLETVAEAYINDDGECEEINYLHNGLPSADGFTELVTRSQAESEIRKVRKDAEELLAAERADHDNTIATLSSLIEDNAALTARVNFLERVTKDQETQITAQEVLEAKLAAAEKDRDDWKSLYVNYRRIG